MNLYGFPTAGDPWAPTTRAATLFETISESCAAGWDSADGNQCLGLILALYVVVTSMIIAVLVWQQTRNVRTIDYQRYVRKNSGNDEKMQPQGRGGNSGGGGDAKRGRSGAGGGGGGGDGDDDDDIQSLIDGMSDLRTDDQRDNDNFRRLNTLCIYIGWFPVRDKGLPTEERPTNPGSKWVYRQCAKSMARKYKPWCRNHYGWENGDRQSDPSFTKKPPKDDKDDKDDKGKGFDKSRKAPDQQGLGVTTWFSLRGIGNFTRK